MRSLYRFTAPGRLVLSVLAISTLAFCHSAFAGTPPSVPTNYQSLYTTLDNDLISFNTTLHSLWNGTKSPVIYSAELWDADANSGPDLIDSWYWTGVQVQLQGLKAMGVQAIMVEIGFPMLYEPFFSSQSVYQEYVNFYSQVASAVKAAGLKLIIENDFLMSDNVQAGWNVAAYYATLDWTQYQQGRAQTAAVVVQTMHPDYIVVLEEPDTEAAQTGQTNVNTVSGATSLVTGILDSLKDSGVSGFEVGAGVGTWLNQYQQFIQSFVTLPLDFIDMHIYPVVNGYLNNALTIATTAANAGKPVSMTECWLNKVSQSQLGKVTQNEIEALNPFSFWEPLDAYFLQTMENVANYTKMTFMNPSNSEYYWAYLTYGSSTENLPPAQILSEESQQSDTNATIVSYTSTAFGYYESILPEPDKTPPSAPTDLAGASTSATEASLSWDASTDNVGVAGYYVFRDGVNIATTAYTYYVDTTVPGAGTYSYFIQAFDLGGNISEASATIQVKTRNLP
jgi:hypothetical protein